MRVLIAGAGIAGLVTAIALRRRGVEAVVVEDAPEDRAQGSGLLLGANALELLTRLGLYDAVRARGREPAKMGVYSSSGSPLSVVDADRWQARYGFRSLAIHREALHAVLLSALPAGTVRHGCALRSFDSTDDHVRIELESGSESCDVLVGADGLRSTVRTALFGPTQLRYSGQTSYRAVVDRVESGGDWADQLCEFWGEEGGLRFGCCPIDDRRTYFFTTHRAPQGGRDETPAHAHARLQDAFRGFVPWVRALVDRAIPERLIRTDILDFAPLRSWHRGRIVLVGDAAHATTPNLGQGACQAIESGYVLARELARRDVERAFREYEATRMARARYVTTMSWRFGRMVGMGGALGRLLKFGLMPRLAKRGTSGTTDKIFKLPY